MSTPSYPELLQSLVSMTLQAGADACDTRMSQSQSLSVEVRDGELEGVEREESRGVALRALVGQRQASVSGSDVSPDALKAMAERVVAMAKAAPEDPYCGIPDADELASTPMDLGLDGDPCPTAEELEKRALAAEAAALEFENIKRNGQASASWGESQTHVAASNGFSASISGGVLSMSVLAIAERDGAMERDHDSCMQRKAKDLRAPEDVGRVAAERAVARLGARKLESQKAPVIFDRRLSNRLLGAFVGAITGPSIARGVSFLKDKMGQQVFAKGVNIIDDPLRMGGFGSRWCDGEGRPVEKTWLIDDGVLNQWLLSGSSARQLGLAPNGFSSMGFGDPPGVTTSNCDIQPGDKDLAGLMKEAGKGLHITDMFGPSINPNTGDYSVGVSGFWFEDGQPAYAVNEVTVAGDLPGMFARLVPGSDLEIRGSSNAPSLLIDGLSLAGI